MPTLQFPTDVDDFQKYPAWILFNIYKRDGLSNKAQVEFASIGLIMPDVPTYITDPEWSHESFGLLGDTMINGSSNISNGNYSAAYDSVIDGAVGALSQSLANSPAAALFKKTTQALGGESVSSDVGKYISGALGVVQNPYLTAIFKSVKQRSFEYMFTFFPKSPEDCKIIKLIVETFNFSSLPNKAVGSYYLGYPYEFHIQYRTRDKENKWLPKNQVAVCEKVQIDYSPDRAFFSSFRNGFPTHVTIRLGFVEKEMPEQRRNGDKPIQSFAEFESIILSDISGM